MSAAVRSVFSAATLCCLVAGGSAFGKRAPPVETDRPLYPGVVNVAAWAEVTANATCGERGAEVFCRLSPRSGACGVCDSRSPDPAKRHPPALAVDGSSRWWQSPSLAEGPQYEWVTLTLDLKQEYQVEYVIVKAGPSPRPGSWVLERSLDADTWRPWQYYAVSDQECWYRFGVRPAPHNSNFQSDSEVICTSYFSRIRPLDGGEIHTSLVRGRPGLNISSAELADFTRARYIRLRLQGMATTSNNKFLKNAQDLPKKLFYTIRDITVGGQCICNGHASECRHGTSNGEVQCECQHNTCGSHCDHCCPLYNQEPWRSDVPCQPCQCFGHATSCHYDPAVAAARISLDTFGSFSGGGVCNNCSKHTTGVNCEQCEPGWYRPLGVRPDADEPCVPCSCHRQGSTGICARDDSQGKPAGTCECRVGFDGERCDSCALGFHNFPSCEPCPCDPDGSLPSRDCADTCQCKSHVEGERCESCKPGYFFLDRDNPDGCSPCYCSGVTHTCIEATGYKLHEVNTLANWLISDANVSRTVLPSLDPDTGLLAIGNYELPGVDNYYWLAPAEYLGNKLTSYGATLTFRVSWVVMRGDTSGKPTMGPDIILVGENGLQLGYGESWYHQNNMSVTVQLVETGWYQLGDGAVTRPQLLSVLADVKYLLLRAKFHKDQVEGSLAFATLETGIAGTGGTAVGYIEQCTCPVGYKGLSCEACDFGFARILPDSSSGRQHAVCSKCNCHGHAETCDPVTGQCGECVHHTVGANCESCAAGYYGDATGQTPADCKPCACPLTESTNNFSPSCHADADDYICTQCPEGYQGSHCQECAPGYFGSPTTPGSSCQLCECGDGPCDQLTGQCVSCRGNTEGWRCEKCKPGHYGNPQEYDCKPCECSVIGAFGEECDPQDGQCACKDRFDGRNCDRCLSGLGNVTAGCVPCECDSEGSMSSLCDAVTGQCSCLPGVGGPHCSDCLPFHYGFTSTGCTRCGCSLMGSLSEECDLDTGECDCRENIIGRACDSCEDGWWGLQEGVCQLCSCDPLGSVNSTCDPVNGQCYCKPGVGSRKCDECLPLFYGLSIYGCAECEICNKVGHVCDPDTGRCVCPPYTQGPECQDCQPNCWGHQHNKGCKQCKCDVRGSMGLQCSDVGQCQCHEGYAGPRCDVCAPGYHGFPHCQPCDCHRAGTKPQHCSGGVCICDNDGQCPCKANAAGKKCDACKAGTFGLQEEQPDGCVSCFCFNRTTECHEAVATWSQVRTPRPRTLVINYDNTTSTETAFPVNTQEVCYINLAVPGSKGLRMNGGESRLNITNNLRIIPGDAWDVEMGVSYLFDSPVYWQLPANFHGDKIMSYGGYLRFTVDTEGATTLLPPGVLSSYPLIQMQGNRLILEHYPMQLNPFTSHSVRFHENFWRMKNNPTSKVNREMLMVALQNVQHILIRATDSVDFTRATLQDVTLDTAILSPRGTLPRAYGLEQCECPPQYNATSCQDPARGYFRHHNKTKPIHVAYIVGEAWPCQCNNRSAVCDIETGRCQDCADSTGGHHCGDCAEGFFGNPDLGGCKPCPCPSVEQNFAFRCDIRAGQEPYCACREGYTGKLCDRCSYGWYGYPRQIGGSCAPCECNPYGSVSDECHEETGQCNCRVGITGRDCSQCQARHILTDRGCASCDDSCTGLLLDKTELLEAELAEKTAHLEAGVLAPPWQQLFQLEHSTMDYQLMLEQLNNVTTALQTLPYVVEDELNKKAKQLFNKAKKAEKLSNTTNFNAFDTKTEADSLFSEIKEMDAENRGIVSQLLSYGVGDKEGISIGSALFQAKLLIGDIRDSNFEPLYNSASKAKDFCSEILANINRDIGNFPDIVSLKNRIDKLQERSLDLDVVLNNLKENTKKALKISEDSKAVLENAQKSIEMSSSIQEDINDMANNSSELINIASVYIDESKDNIDGLQIMRDQLRNVTMVVEEKESDLSVMNPINENEYVRPAERHAEELMMKAQQYADLFVATRQDAGFALQASKAYQDIVDALQGAKEAAENAGLAADDAYKKVYPGVGEQSLVDKATVIRAQSREIEELLVNSRQAVKELHDGVAAPEASVTVLRDVLTATAHADNGIARELHKLGTDFVGKAATDALMAAEELEDETMLLKSEADSVGNKIENELKPALKKLTFEGEESINAAQKMISEVNANVRKAQDLASHITMTTRRQNEEFAVWNNSLSAKLNELRSKIMQARHIADGIRLSVTSQGDSGSCVRTYEPSQLEPSTMTSIVLTYAISSQQRDALLFYLPSTNSEDFVAIEMVNRKMRFVWNVGGGPGEVTHPLHIQSAGDLSNDQHWYRVEAERISNVGRLSVRPQVLPDGSPLTGGMPVSNASAAGAGRLDVGPGDRVWVGGADKRPPQLLSTQPGLVGCLHRLTLNGRPIGLWDFRTQSHNACTACIEGAEEVKDEQSYTFSGDGYVVLKHDSSSAYNKYLFSVSLNFRTFDENALLFLAVSSQPDRFVSLTLLQGRIVFRIGYGGDSSLEMTTLKTYNNGNWTRLEASRYFDRKKKVEKGVLKVDGEIRDGAPTPPPGQDAIPDLAGANFYVGGVPPGFKVPISLPGSFLGCMSDLQVLQEGYNLLRNRFWGVQASCSEKPLTIVGFNGDGFLELASHSLKKKSSFGFAFATTQQDALLMLSTFEGLAGQLYQPLEDNEEITNTIEQEDRLSYYTVSLRRGQLDVRLNAGRGESRLASTGSEYADGRFHSLALSKMGRRLELRVDDTLHASTTLPEGATVVKAPGAAGGLFFGGLPPGFNTTGRTVSNVPFIGTIKDAIFNDELLHFDWPVSFEHAAIGRLGPVQGTAVQSTPVMAARAVPGCRKVAAYSLQPGAVKFGDSAFTHVHINFRKRNTFQKNFTLEVRFRTFYAEGLIFVVPGARGKQHFIMASLYNGRLQVVLKGRKKVEISSQAVLNDGTWHHMILQKENRKIILKIDYIAPEKAKVPFKRMNVGSVMYVGGIPDAALSLPMSLISKIEGFKGCVEGLQLNGHGEDLVGDKAVPHRVGQCFPHIERGSYFPGDAYATYKSDFEVGSLLDVELEFRTSEMSGILLSVAEPQGYPALSLELDNGKVVLSGDMGDRRPFRLEQGFASEFVVCDNRWHHLSARYADGRLTLRADGLEQSYWLADHGHLTEAHTSSPLYIGGLPDHAPSGTLQTRENFKGCIRNVRIGGERKDWTSMAGLHNILLSSCPLPS